MKLIVGLGNPGREYRETRHNAGFLALQAFAEIHRVHFASDASFSAEVGKTFFQDEKILLAKPTTYMNESGRAVQALLSFYKINPHDLLIVHDELDLAPGMLAFSYDRGHAGHNGVASIFASLGRQDIARLRLGIGRPLPPQPTEVWVLGPISEETRATAQASAQAIEYWLEHGTDKAMNHWNRRSTS